MPSPLAPLLARTKSMQQVLQGGLFAYMRRRGWVLALALCVSCSLLLTAQASEGQALPEPAGSASGYTAKSSQALTPLPPVQRYWWASFGAGAAIGFKWGPQRDAPRRVSSPLDDWARSALRAPTPGLRSTFSTLSHVGVTLSLLWPIADSLWWLTSEDAALRRQSLWELTATAQALALNGALQAAVSWGISRERPFGDGCAPAEGGRCASTNRYHSFYSAHTARSFAAASVGCVHRHFRARRGLPRSSQWPCAVALSVAAGTGLARIATEAHYLTDVLAGAAAGALVGGGIAYWLDAEELEATEAGLASRFWLAPFGLGLSAGGAF